MDALYILGNGSIFNNEELRYSMRTLEKHVHGIDRVVIVGENPGFLSSEVAYHPLRDVNGNKEYRISQKIFTACREGWVSEKFFFLNDDFFFLKNIDAYNYPNYYKGSLWPTGNGAYQQALKDTANYLSSLGRSTYHFDVHTPIVYDREKFLELDPHFEQSKRTQYGFVVKSLYGNIYQLPRTRYRDCKLNRLKELQDYERILKTNIFSCSDIGWRRGVAQYVKRTNPNPSKYELQHETA